MSAKVKQRRLDDEFKNGLSRTSIHRVSCLSRCPISDVVCSLVDEVQSSATKDLRATHACRKVKFEFPDEKLIID